VAADLAATFTEDRVLYDRFHDAEFARPDLNIYLPNLYRKESDLLVVFLCPDYPQKVWCRLEWRFIVQLIQTVDAKRIMFLSFGPPGDLSDIGILSGDGYIDVTALTPETVAAKISKRLSINQRQGQPARVNVVAQPAMPVPTRAEAEKRVELSRPRVYLSYTWRTEGLKERALALADRLREEGIDSRLDLYFAKSLHGFTPPDPIPNGDSWEAWQKAEIAHADRVLVICSEEYAESPRGSGAWRDVAFMKQDLATGAPLRKFIPAGFGGYQVNGQFVPHFIHGATYYDLTPGVTAGFGFDDLVRRFRTEFPGHQRSNEDPSDTANRALRLIGDREYDQALDALTSVIASDPSLGEAYYNRGLTYYYKNDLKSAIADFDRAEARGFRDVLVYRNRANALAGIDDVGRALDDYKTAIELDPDNPIAYLNRGLMYENTRQKALAIADYQAALNRAADPQTQDAARARLLALGVKA